MSCCLHLFNHLILSSLYKRSIYFGYIHRKTTPHQPFSLPLWLRSTIAKRGKDTMRANGFRMTSVSVGSTTHHLLLNIHSGLMYTFVGSTNTCRMVYSPSIPASYNSDTQQAALQVVDIYVLQPPLNTAQPI